MFPLIRTHQLDLLIQPSKILKDQREDQYSFIKLPVTITEQCGPATRNVVRSGSVMQNQKIILNRPNIIDNKQIPMEEKQRKTSQYDPTYLMQNKTKKLDLHLNVGGTKLKLPAKLEKASSPGYQQPSSIEDELLKIEQIQRNNLNAISEMINAKESLFKINQQMKLKLIK